MGFVNFSWKKIVFFFTFPEKKKTLFLKSSVCVTLKLFLGKKKTPPLDEEQICRYFAMVMPGFPLSVAQKSTGLDTNLITIVTIPQRFPKRYTWLYPVLSQNGPDLQPSTPILCDGGLKVDYIFVENRIFSLSLLSSLWVRSISRSFKTSECVSNIWSKSMFLKKI